MEKQDTQTSAIRFIGKNMTPFVAHVISETVYNATNIAGQYGIHQHDKITEFTLYPDDSELLTNSIFVEFIIKIYDYLSSFI